MLPGIALGGALGVGSKLAQVAIGSLPGGAIQGNLAWTEGKDKGLSAADTLTYAIAQGAVESGFEAASFGIGRGLTPAIFKKLGGEQATKNLMTMTVGKAIKDFGLNMGGEQATEIATSLSQLGIDYLYGVNPQALSRESIIRNLVDTIGTTAMLVGAMQGPMAVMDVQKASKLKATRKAVAKALGVGVNELPETLRTLQQREAWVEEQKQKAQQRAAITSQQIPAEQPAVSQAPAEQVPADQQTPEIVVSPLQPIRDLHKQPAKDMTPDQLRQRLLTHSLTGLPNEVAFQEDIAANQYTHFIFADTNGLKWMNDNFDHSAGNLLLTSTADAMAGTGINWHHKSGDEFMAGFHSEAEARKAQESLAKALPGVSVLARGADGKMYAVSPNAATGIGTTLEEADHATNRAKEEAVRAGKQSVRGGKPAGVVEVAPEGSARAGNVADNQRQAVPIQAQAAAQVAAPVVEQPAKPTVISPEQPLPVVAQEQKANPFANVPEDQLRAWAQTGVEGAKVELRRRRGEALKAERPKPIPVSEPEAKPKKPEVSPAVKGQDVKPQPNPKVEVAGFVEDPEPVGAENAMAGRYRGNRPSIAVNPAVFTMVDLVQLVNEINQTPEIWTKLRGRAGKLGAFQQTEGGRIILRDDIFAGEIITEGTMKSDGLAETEAKVVDSLLQKFTELTASDIIVKEYRGSKPGETRVKFIRKDSSFAAKVLSHEIGHLIDWLPDETLKRGGILGHVAVLRKYLSRIVEDSPPINGHWLEDKIGKDEWKKIQAKLRGQARKEVAKDIDPKDSPDLFKEAARERFRELRDEWLLVNGFITRDAIATELKDLTLWWNPFDPDADERYTKYRFSAKELYAEAVSVLLNNPAELKSRAPTFYDAFFAYLARKPEVLDAYQKATAQIAAGTSLETAAGKLQDEFRTGAEKVLSEMHKDSSPSISEAMVEILSNFVDANWYVARRVRGMKRAGMKIAPAMNPEIAYETAVYSGSEENQYLKDATSRLKALEKATGMPRGAIAEVLFHGWVISGRSDIASPYGFTSETSSQRLEQIRQRFGDENVDAVLDYIEQNHAERMKYLADNPVFVEMVGKETADMLRRNKNYARNLVVDKIDSEHGSGAGAGIFKQIGTLKGIADPILTTALWDASAIWTANWNHAKLSVVDFFLQNFPSEVEKVAVEWSGDHWQAKPPTDPDKKLLTLMRDGKVEGYYVTKWIADAHNHTRSDQFKQASAIMRMVNGFFRGIYVLINLGFQVANPLRDVDRATRHAKGIGLSMIPRTLRAMVDTFGITYLGKSIPEIEELKRNKALISEGGLFGLVSDYELTDRRLRDMMPDGRDLRAAAKEKDAFRVLSILADRVTESMGKFITATEWAPKLAMSRHLNEVAPEMHPLEKAEVVRRAGSPKFLIKGRAAQLTNSLFIFATPLLQSWREDITLARQQPGEQLMKFALYHGVPKVTTWAIRSGAVVAALLAAGLKDDDDIVTKAKELQRMLEGISERYLMRGHTIPLYLDENGKTVAITIPHDQNAALLTGLLWVLMDAAYGKDVGESAPSKTAKLLVDSLRLQLSPAISAVGDMLQYARGVNPRDNWSDRPMVPESLFQARNWKTHEWFAKSMWNKYGPAGIVGYFDVYGKDDPKGYLERIIATPGVQQTLGRLLKVTDYGLKEREKQKKAIMEREQARERENRRLPGGKLIPKWRRHKLG